MIRKYVSVNINIRVGWVIIYIYVLLSAQLSSAIDVTPCKDCHGKIEPIPSSQLTKNCLACHDTHGTPKGCCQPTIRDPTKGK